MKESNQEYFSAKDVKRHMKIDRLSKVLSQVVLLTLAVPLAHASEWHEGKMLNSGDNKTWLEASSADRLATAASTVASMYYGDFLKRQYSKNISDTDIDTMRPMAEELVICINTAAAGMKEDGLTVSVKYSDLAVGCVVGMGWSK